MELEKSPGLKISGGLIIYFFSRKSGGYNTCPCFCAMACNFLMDSGSMGGGGRNAPAATGSPISSKNVTLRIWLPLLAVVYGDFNKAYVVVAWLCWVPNIFVAYLLTRNMNKSENQLV